MRKSVLAIAAGASVFALVAAGAAGFDQSGVTTAYFQGAPGPLTSTGITTLDGGGSACTDITLDSLSFTTSTSVDSASAAFSSISSDCNGDTVTLTVTDGATNTAHYVGTLAASGTSDTVALSLKSGDTAFPLGQTGVTSSFSIANP